MTSQLEVMLARMANRPVSGVTEAGLHFLGTKKGCHQTDVSLSCWAAAVSSA
jgi:hypothetical protein